MKQFFKYLGLLLIFFLIKILTILISVGLVGLVMYLCQMGTVWGWILAYLPSIIIWIYFTISMFLENIDDVGVIAVFVVILFSFVPGLIISMGIFLYGMSCPFPTISYWRSLKEEFFWNVVKDLFVAN